MAYESTLFTTALLSGGQFSSSLTTGYSASLFFNISATTLGSQLADDAVRLDFQTVPTLVSGVSGLSATAGSSSFLLTLTAGSFAKQQYTGSIKSSTWSPTSATIAFGFNSPNLPNTFIYLSASNSGTVLDPTQTSTMDNWFFATTNPEPGLNRGVRTTAGHARLVAYMG